MHVLAGIHCRPQDTTEWYINETEKPPSLQVSPLFRVFLCVCKLYVCVRVCDCKIGRASNNVCAFSTLVRKVSDAGGRVVKCKALSRIRYSRERDRLMAVGMVGRGSRGEGGTNDIQ